MASPTPGGSADAAADTWLVVGLGNPGPTYTGHRHNIGYRVVDAMADRVQGRFGAASRLRADVVETRLVEGATTLGGIGLPQARVVLARPRSFMNSSGGPVKKLADYYKATPERMVVIHDELDLDLGRLRIKCGGGDNGHNGLRSIRSSLGTGDFYRVRFGIGRPPGRQDPAAFVLSGFSTSERAGLAVEIERAADAVECLIAEGLPVAQNRFNS